jgi:hypothetical protein
MHGWQNHLLGLIAQLMGQSGMSLAAATASIPRAKKRPFIELLYPPRIEAIPRKEQNPAMTSKK